MRRSPSTRARTSSTASSSSSGRNRASCAPARRRASTYRAGRPTPSSAQPVTRPGSRRGYVGTATRGRGISELLEAAAPLPVGHDPPERRPLLPGGVHEVLVDRLAECVDRELALLELGDGVDDGAGDTLDEVAVVGVAVERGSGIFLVLDSV